MSTENWSQDVLLVCLPPGPKTVNELELESVTDTVRDRGDCDVVIDFSSVDTLTFAAIEKLLTLHNVLTECGRGLVLCSVCDAIKSVLAITRPEHVFEFARDKSVPLIEVQFFHDADRPVRIPRAADR